MGPVRVRIRAYIRRYEPVRPGNKRLSKHATTSPDDWLSDWSATLCYAFVPLWKGACLICEETGGQYNDNR